jgi:hypothetical protein
MTAAREVGLSLPVIAEHFDKDHGSVIHAVRRTPHGRATAPGRRRGARHRSRQRPLHRPTPPPRGHSGLPAPAGVDVRA